MRTSSAFSEPGMVGNAYQRPPLHAQDILKGREAAELLGVPVSTVYDYAKRGILPSRRLGMRVIFLRPEFENWLWDHAA